MKEKPRYSLWTMPHSEWTDPFEGYASGEAKAPSPEAMAKARAAAKKQIEETFGKRKRVRTVSQTDETQKMPAQPSPTIARQLRHFSYEHLSEPMRAISKPFHDLAHGLASRGDLDVHDLTVCLRKLVEAKDCAVRSALK